MKLNKWYMLLLSVAILPMGVSEVSAQISDPDATLDAASRGFLQRQIDLVGGGPTVFTDNGGSSSSDFSVGEESTLGHTSRNFFEFNFGSAAGSGGALENQWVVAADLILENNQGSGRVGFSTMAGSGSIEDRFNSIGSAGQTDFGAFDFNVGTNTFSMATAGSSSNIKTAINAAIRDGNSVLFGGQSETFGTNNGFGAFVGTSGAGTALSRFNLDLQTNANPFDVSFDENGDTFDFNVETGDLVLTAQGSDNDIAAFGDNLTFSWTINGTSLGDGATLTLTESQVSLLTGGFADFDLDIELVATDSRGATSSFDGTVTAVPEPGSMALCLVGLAAAGLIRRRKS